MKSNEKSSVKSTDNTTAHKGTDLLHRVFEEELKDIYWAEHHLVKSIPKMSKAASSSKLKKALDDHLAQTQGQIERLDKVFSLMGQKPASKKCEAMDGLVKEGEEAIEEFEQGAGRDAALIIAAQKVEHYEIAAYGSLKNLAHIMGMEDCVKLFDETLEEEHNADESLTTIAEKVNQEAYAMEPA